MRGRGEIAVRDAVDRFVPKLGLAGLRERYMDARGDHLLDQAKFHVVGGGKFPLKQWGLPPEGPEWHGYSRQALTVFPQPEIVDLGLTPGTT